MKRDDVGKYCGIQKAIKCPHYWFESSSFSCISITLTLIEFCTWTSWREQVVHRARSTPINQTGSQILFPFVNWSLKSNISYAAQSYAYELKNKSHRVQWDVFSSNQVEYCCFLKYIFIMMLSIIQTYSPVRFNATVILSLQRAAYLRLGLLFILLFLLWLKNVIYQLSDPTKGKPPV